MELFCLIGFFVTMLLLVGIGNLADRVLKLELEVESVNARLQALESDQQHPAS